MPSSKRKISRKKSGSVNKKKRCRRNDGDDKYYNELVKKFEINKDDKRSVLMKLVHHNNSNYVKKYMKEQIEPKLTPREQIKYINRKDEFAYTALILASINGNLELIQYLLLEKKASRHPKYLIYVIIANELKIIEKIVNDETTTDQHSLMMALFYCVENKLQNEIIECLIDNIKLKDEFINHLEKVISNIDKSQENNKEINLYTEVILSIKKYKEKYSHLF